ncbi:MAG: hypothetical protein ACR2F9_05985, partial [Longimicrobiaceae bacterium]
YIGLGKMWIARGSFPKARKSLLKALRAAEQDEELREIEGMAAHDLCTVEIDCDREASVSEYARAALAAYGPGHRLLPSLAHDVAFFWLKRGEFARSLPILLTVVTRLSHVHRIVCYGNIARAAAALGRAELYEVACAEVMSESNDSHPRKGDAYVALAHAALSLNFLEDAEAYALTALRIAGNRSESEVAFVAQGIREAVLSAKAALSNQSDRAEATAVKMQMPDELVTAFIEHLESCETVLAD